MIHTKRELGAIMGRLFLRREPAAGARGLAQVVVVLAAACFTAGTRADPIPVPAELKRSRRERIRRKARRAC